MKKTILFLIIILTLNSCATILNGKKTIVKISADKESKIVFEKDTIPINKKEIIIYPNRSKKPLKIIVLKDSLSQDFYFNRKISSLFALNFFNNYGIGILVDLTNNKRFTYRHNLHFITDSISKKILLSNKKVTVLPKNNFLLYTSPLQALDLFSIPMFTFGTEYFIQNNISLSAEFGYKIKNATSSYEHTSYLKDNAFTYRFETKLYNVINLTNNVHLNEYVSLEFRKIKSQYNDYLEYTERDNTDMVDYITDDFGTKKNVTIINLKYGLLVPLGEIFYFDFYSGLGIRIKKFNHINLEYNKSIHQIDFSDDLSFFDFRSFKNYDQKSFLNYSLGFKFGIKL